MVSNYWIGFGIFLVSMLFVPPSMSTTAAQDSEIPAWIKNNAGWWASFESYFIGRNDHA